MVMVPYACLGSSIIALYHDSSRVTDNVDVIIDIASRGFAASIIDRVS
jgi:hypothetical protein